MATSGASVKLRRLRQRFGISAPKLSIRTHMAWYWRVLPVVVIVSVSLTLAAWMSGAGVGFSVFQNNDSAREIQLLRNHVMELDAELSKLRSLVGSGESSLQIERTTRKQLSHQAQALEYENAALKEDLAFFEGLVPASESADEQGIRIDHFRVESGGAAGEYRYRMLVVNNGGRLAKELRASLQLLVKVRQAGKDVMITLPSSAEPNPQRFRIEIKHFHRLEGGFSIPLGGVVKDVEARLVQDGIVRARQTVVF